jgi:hypothetical protein
LRQLGLEDARCSIGSIRSTSPNGRVHTVAEEAYFHAGLAFGVTLSAAG